MMHGALITLALVALASCGGNNDEHDNAATDAGATADGAADHEMPPSYACEKTDRNGTFLFHYTQASGDCLPLDDAVLTVEDASAVAANCTLDQPDEWTDGDCTLQRVVTCTSTGGAIHVESTTTQLDEAGDGLAGTMTTTSTDLGGAVLCEGTYLVSAERQ